MSAQSLLAGLYPTTSSGQRFDPALAWQPVPVHTVSPEEDIVSCLGPGGVVTKTVGGGGVEVKFYPYKMDGWEHFRHAEGGGGGTHSFGVI